MCGLSGSTITFHIISKRHDFLKKNYWTQCECVCVCVYVYIYIYIYIYTRSRMWTRKRICGNWKILACPQDQSEGQRTECTYVSKMLEPRLHWHRTVSFHFFAVHVVSGCVCSLHPLEQENPHSTYFSFLMFRDHRQRTTVDGKSPLPFLQKSIKIVMGLGHWWNNKGKLKSK